MSRLSHEEFFTSLTSLLTTTTQKSRGSVYLSQKPLLHGHDTGTNTSESEELNIPILVRATDGRTDNPNTKSKDGKQKATKVKLSTVVEQGDLEGFYARYAEVCKAGMTGLKKRDRKKGKAKKGAAAGKVGKA